MEKVLKDVDETISDLQDVFNAFEASQINIVPFEGSWTAGQLAMHMVLSNGGFAEVINGQVDETSRPVDKNIEQIKSILLDSNVKMNSPEMIYPKLKDYDQDKLLNQLEGIKKALVKAADQLDLTKTCVAFELPSLGFLTRLEAFYFVIYHTRRHTNQLKNILEQVKSSAN
jgi:uncharacterized damage-inducible protein DinB